VSCTSPFVAFGRYDDNTEWRVRPRDISDGFRAFFANIEKYTDIPELKAFSWAKNKEDRHKVLEMWLEVWNNCLETRGNNHIYAAMQFYTSESNTTRHHRIQDPFAMVSLLLRSLGKDAMKHPVLGPLLPWIEAIRLYADSHIPWTLCLQRRPKSDSPPKASSCDVVSLHFG